MQVTPKTDKELSNLFEEGTYDAEIVKAEEATSSKGNDMIVVTLRVYDGAGSSKFVTDYLMDKIPYKLKHICKACDLLPDYENGTIDAAKFVGKSVKIKLNIQEDKENKYPDKNIIKDYISGTKTMQPASTKMVDDSIPF